MDYPGRIASLFLLSTAFQCFALAQAANDPGFDPTPVEIPNIQKTTPRSVTSMDLLTLRDVQDIQISPDGKYVAFVVGQAVYETNHYRSGMFVIGTEKGSKPISLGTAGPPRWDETNEWVSEKPEWSPNSRYIYRVMRNSGARQVWRWDREGGLPAQVTHAKYDVQSFLLSLDSERLFMVIETPSVIDSKQLAERGILYDGSFSATAQPIVDLVAAARGGKSEAWIQDLRSGSAHKATMEEQEELEVSADTDHTPNGKLFTKLFTQKEIKEQNILDFIISPDQKKVAYSRMANNPSESERTTFPLLVKPLDGEAPLSVVRWPLYPGNYWWSPDSKEIYYTEDHGGNADSPRNTQLMAVAATGGKARQVLDSPGFLRQYSADRSRHLVACLRENGTTPGEVVLADLSTGEIRTLLDVNPEFQNLRLSPAKRIDVSDKQGDHFWGHVVLPLDYEPGQRYPLIITTYRDYDGFLRGGVGDEYPIQVFAASGFAVLNLEAVGQIRNPEPGDFDRTILLWQGPTEATEAAVARLAEQGIVDPSRVGITGLSFGAVMVNYGISHTNLFRAAIASGPAWDPILFFTSKDEHRTGISHGLNLESPDGDSRGRWQRESAALNARRVNTPLLINVADEEYIDDMQLVNNLRELKKPVEMFIYVGERHIKNQPKHRYEIYERNVDWFNFWLRDKKDPNPAKAEQYKRWRELRQLRDRDKQSILGGP